MKKGKTSKLNIFDDAKCQYGTVDSKNLKSVYINIQSWVTPKNEEYNWTRVVSNLNREIKNSVTESIDQNIFLDKNIVDLDLRTSGISKGKKSFFNLEINLYTTINTDFRSQTIKESVKNIVKTIYQNNVGRNQYFDFSISKKPSEV